MDRVSRSRLHGVKLGGVPRAFGLRVQGLEFRV